MLLFIFSLLFLSGFVISFPLMYIAKPLNVENNIGLIVFYSLFFPFIFAAITTSMLKGIHMKCY